MINLHLKINHQNEAFVITQRKSCYALRDSVKLPIYQIVLISHLYAESLRVSRVVEGGKLGSSLSTLFTHTLNVHLLYSLLLSTFYTNVTMENIG